MTVPMRQKAYSDIAEFREDAFLFKGGLVRVQVDVTPHKRRTPRGDLILRGFMKDTEIEVVFPGRRNAAAQPLLQRLHQLAELKRHEAGLQGRAPIENIRHPIRVEGVWRSRLVDNHNGMPVRCYQLLAARWRLREANGMEQIHGDLPLN